MSIKEKQLLKNLEYQLGMMRSFIIGIAGRDTEGRYDPKFVDKIIESDKKNATRKFISSEQFLKSLKKIPKRQIYLERSQTGVVLKVF